MSYAKYKNFEIIFSTLFKPSKNDVNNEAEFENTFYKVADFLVAEYHYSNEDMEYLKRKLEATHLIKHDDGVMILGDYEHKPWYKNDLDSFSTFHWDRYESYLIKKNFPRTSIDAIANSSIEIINALGDPRSDKSYSMRGLVVGDVQSGKTSNYLGLISKIVDAGYRVVILLTGMTENLRRQTQIRVEEGFVGFDSVAQKRVGVGEDGLSLAKSATNRKEDFIGSAGRNTFLEFDTSKESNEPYIFVVKKNVSVLQKLFNALKEINTLPTRPQIEIPLIMIDDEADNASINTNNVDQDPTRTNEQLRKILNLFSKSAYVGFTATPFANVFIDPTTDHEMLSSDLFPKDFIYALKSPSNYFGPEKMFDDNYDFIRIINDDDQSLFSHRHRKDWYGTSFFPSLKKSIITFLIANVIRDLRKDTGSHRTMLINVSRFINVQYTIKDIVKSILCELRINIKHQIHRSDELALQNDVIKEIYKVWEEEYKKQINWIDLKKNFNNSIKNIEVHVVNSRSNSDILNYEENDDEGLRVIAIGGLALSRGVTLEGLIVSYFYRNTSTFDVLMQMGRWFGYRNNYDDLCRVWLSDDSLEWYEEIMTSTNLLKKDIETMRLQNKKPMEFGIRVRNNSEALGITSRRKMLAARERKERESFYGNFFETPYLSKDYSSIRSNYKAIIELIEKLKNQDEKVRNPYFRNVENHLIIDTLNKLKIDEASLKFDIPQLKAFILNSNNIKNKKWDVLFMQGKSKDNPTIKLTSTLEIIPPQRGFDFINENVIRISKSNARLGAPSDFAFGLKKQELDNIKNEYGESPNARNFLIKTRNPLFIVYVLRLKRDLDPTKTFFLDYLSDNNMHVIGFSLAFPSVEDLETKAIDSYYVNSKADYFTQQLIEESIEGEEDDE